MALEWSEFAQRFARELAALPRDTILIVREREEIRHYVQAMWEPDRLYAEAVSNNFLEGPLLLKPADEEVLTETGWRPPAPQVSANWWTELPMATSVADFDRLSDMMVTALRDVQGVRRPADLVYESFRRLGTGLIELVDFGIEVADSQRVTERLSARAVAGPAGSLGSANSNGAANSLGSVSSVGSAGEAALSAGPVSAPIGDGGDGWSSADRPAGQADPALAADPVPPADPIPGLEERLGDAKQRGDHVTYFELLLRTDLVLPATGQAVEDPGVSEFTTNTIDDNTLVLVFTSPQAMAQSLGPRAGLHRKTTFRQIAAAWPDPAWSMSVNPGLPSGIVLDSATVARLEGMRRTAEQAATVDAVVTPPTPGVAIRLPHGTQLWRVAEPPGVPAVPLAVYDAMNARWSPAPDGGRSQTAGEFRG